MRPFFCHSDVNKCSTTKVWGAMLEDINSGAVYCDIVSNYSTEVLVLMLKHFSSIRGWPVRLMSDPRSQLESAAGKLSSWWWDMKDSMMEMVGKFNLTWETSPADLPWRQGKCERGIGVVKRLIKIAVGDCKLSPIEFQTVLFEAANLCNKRTIGINKQAQSDGSY